MSIILQIPQYLTFRSQLQALTSGKKEFKKEIQKEAFLRQLLGT